MNSTSKTLLLEGILNGLMSRYQERVKDVNKILDALIQKEVIAKYNDIENDHIAFRTMGVDNLGIKSLEKIFLHCGYQKKDYFRFEGKKLDAWWYSPPEARFPRIFISQLRVQDLPEPMQFLIQSYTNEVTSDPVDQLNLDSVKDVDHFLHSSLWRAPSRKDYTTLLKESEYAGWVIYNRYYLNHYTVSVHNLKEGYNTLEQFNTFLESIGIKLNDSGGKIKISEDNLLLQSSTVSALCEAEFANGVKDQIAGSYVEFAERKVLPQFSNLPAAQIKREHRRDGFETGNADKIFESTYTDQIKRT